MEVKSRKFPLEYELVGGEVGASTHMAVATVLILPALCAVAVPVSNTVCELTSPVGVLTVRLVNDQAWVAGEVLSIIMQSIPLEDKSMKGDCDGVLLPA